MWKIIWAIITIAFTFVGLDCSGKVMKVTEAWSRATPAGATTAEDYLTIQNRLDTADTLLTLTSYVAEDISLAETSNVNGVNESQPLATLTIPAGKDITLKPNRTVIVLKKLKQPLKAGDKFPLTLTFEKGGQVLEDVKVEPASTLSYPK